MGWLSRTWVIATALVVVALVVPLAGANGPMGGTENVSLTLPADGSGTATRAPMPASSTVGTIAVKTTSPDDGFFDTLTTILTNKPTFGARAVSCVLLYAVLVNGDYKDFTNFKETSHDLDDLFLHICIQLALSLSQTGAARDAVGAATAARCGMRIAAVPVKITRTASGYQAVVRGTPYTSKPRGVRISCTPTATGLKITEKARKRGGKLSRATGPILGVGFSSRSSSPGKLKIALGVR